MISCELTYHVATVLLVSCGGVFPRKNLVLNLGPKGHLYHTCAWETVWAKPNWGEYSMNTHQLNRLYDINNTVIRVSDFLLSCCTSVPVAAKAEIDMEAATNIAPRLPPSVLPCLLC